MAKSVGRNAAYNLIGSALPLALSLATVPLYLKLVGPDRYSVLAIAWLFLGYFGLFDLGLGRATAYRIAAQKDAPAEDRAVTFWTATLINPMIGVVTGGILWVVSGWYFSSVFKVDAMLRPEILASVPLLALSVPIATLTGTLTGTLQGREQFLRINMISVTSTALFQILPLTIAFTHGPNLPLLLGSAMLARLLGVVWLWLECHKEVGRGFRPRISRERFKDLMNYGGWISVSTLLAPMLTALDRFIIGGGLGAFAVTNYSVPMQMVQRVAIFPNALMSAIFPKVASLGVGDRLKYGEISVRFVSSVLLAPMCVAAAFAKPLFSLWVGSKLGLQMAPVASILILSFWLNAIAIVYVVQLQATGQPKRITMNYLIQTPIYLGLLFFLMSKYGVEGCALALAIRSFADLLLQSLALDGKFPPAVVYAHLILMVGSVVAALTGAPFTVLALIVLAAVALSIVTLPDAGRAAIARLFKLPKPD